MNPLDPDPLPTEVELVCVGCDYIWLAEAVRDLGFVELIGEPDCPGCGSTGVEV